MIYLLKFYKIMFSLEKLYKIIIDNLRKCIIVIIHTKIKYFIRSLKEVK